MKIPPSKVNEYLKYYPVALAYCLLTLAMMARWKLRPRLAWILAVAGVLLFFAKVIWLYSPAGDFQICWHAGNAWLHGQDPYAASNLIIYPPSAMPLYGIAALLPLAASRLVWIALTVAGAILLVPLARAVLKEYDAPQAPSLTAAQTLLLAATLALSLPVHFTLGLGQVTIFVALGATAALYAQARRWPILAGVLLALTAIKPQSALPLLLLFHRKRDWPTWLSGGLTIGLLLLLSGPPGQLIQRCHEMTRNVAILSNGHVNDFTDSAAQVYTLVGFDRVMYCFGFTDRSAVRIGQIILTLLTAAWLAHCVLGPRRLPHLPACVMVLLFTMLFLYHRTYDASLLALPLVYCADRAIRPAEAGRNHHFIAGLLILAVIFIHPKMVQLLCTPVQSIHVLGILVRIVLEPYIMWLILAAMLCVRIGSKINGTGAIPFGTAFDCTHNK